MLKDKEILLAELILIFRGFIQCGQNSDKIDEDSTSTIFSILAINFYRTRNVGCYEINMENHDIEDTVVDFIASQMEECGHRLHEETQGMEIPLAIDVFNMLTEEYAEKTLEDLNQFFY